MSGAEVDIRSERNPHALYRHSSPLLYLKATLDDLCNPSGNKYIEICANRGGIANLAGWFIFPDTVVSRRLLN